MREEFSRYNALRFYYQGIPNLAQYLECDSCDTFGILISPQYFPLTEKESIAHACTIVENFRVLGRKERITLEDLPEMRIGLCWVKKNFGEQYSNILEFRIKKILEREFSIGPCHGDFHERNIMMDHDATPVVVDYDCCRIRGIQEFDPIYYIVQNAAFLSGSHWLIIVCSLLSTERIPANYYRLNVMFEGDLQELLFIFSIDRIGQEIRFSLDSIQLRKFFMQFMRYFTV
jgi:hypothetical protein